MNDPMPTHRGRVLVIATTFPRWAGDSEPAFVHHLSASLVKLGYQITVLAPHHKGAKRSEAMDGLNVVRFPYFWPAGLQRLCYEGGILPNLKSRWSARLSLSPFLVAQFLAIGTMIRRDQFQLIHSHWLLPQGFFSALWCRRERIPYLITAHGSDVFVASPPLIRQMARFTLTNAGAVTANSVATRQALLRLAPGVNPLIIPNGVHLALFDPRQFSPTIRATHGNPTALLLAVGRFVEKKGFAHLLHAMPEILKTFPSTKLLIAGYGPLEAELTRQAQALDVQRSVVFLGGLPSTELAKYYATADLFVCPSIRAPDGGAEGQAVTILEAFASGTCVVASNVGGIPDMVRDGETGLLVEEKSPDQIASAVIRLLGDSNLRGRLRQNARDWVLQHANWEEVAGRFAELYSRLLSESPR